MGEGQGPYMLTIFELVGSQWGSVDPQDQLCLGWAVMRPQLTCSLEAPTGQTPRSALACLLLTQSHPLVPCPSPPHLTPPTGLFTDGHSQRNQTMVFGMIPTWYSLPRDPLKNLTSCP